MVIALLKVLSTNFQIVIGWDSSFSTSSSYPLTVVFFKGLAPLSVETVLGVFSSGMVTMGLLCKFIPTIRVM